MRGRLKPVELTQKLSWVTIVEKAIKIKTSNTKLGKFSFPGHDLRGRKRSRYNTIVADMAEWYKPSL
jgi:hypothetical protein